jgi:hypothetical protein
MSIQVQILKDFNAVSSRSITTKEGPKVIYSQKGFLNKGGPFPVEFSLNVESPALAYPVGDYILDLSCLVVNKFGSLEVNPFTVKLDKAS